MKIEHLYKSFPSKTIFKDFSLSVEPGSILFITGASGVGKTTLLNIIAGLEKADAGSVTDTGTISYLFQEPRLLPWKSAFENVAFVSSASDAQKYLKLVGLENEMHNRPSQLSGGQKQRVALARALAYKSDVLLMDEPFQNLDEKLFAQLVNEFLSIHEADGRTVIWVTHDLQQIKAAVGNRLHNYSVVTL